VLEKESRADAQMGTALLLYLDFDSFNVIVRIPQILVCKHPLKNNEKR